MDKIGESRSKYGNPYDINGQHFNPDMYMQKLLKELSLEGIMEQEKVIVKDAQILHSDMQTLVYENYNKFISATDTIKKMKNDFKQMEIEMDSLGKNMDSIISFSGQISVTLQDTRQQISKLSGVHSLLKKLQFLFKLPNKLKDLMDEGNYNEAVHDYLQARQVLDHYAHLESFKGIRNDCLEIVEQLKENLRSQFRSEEATSKGLSQSVELLLLLGEPAESLYSQFLAHATTRLEKRIEQLGLETTEDLISFVDTANNGVLCDLCFVVTSYNDMFLTSHDQAHEDSDNAVKMLNDFIDKIMPQLMKCIQNRVRTVMKQEQCDISTLVKALDKFYRKLCTVTPLFKNEKFLKQGIELIIKVGKKQCKSKRKSLEANLTKCLCGVRQNVAKSETQSVSQSVAQGEAHRQTDLGDLLVGLVHEIVKDIKESLDCLKLFIHPEFSFTQDKEFVDHFSIVSLRGSLLVGFLEHIANTATSFTKATCPSLFILLILAKLCAEFSTKNVQHLLRLVDEWFNIKPSKELSAEKDKLCNLMQSGAHTLVNHYVRMQGNIISQMIRKSIDTRDWVHHIEPRKVRPVMKRVLEELESSDQAVGSLFEEGGQPTGPGSGSRHQYHRSAGSSFWSPGSSYSYTYNVNKLFSDKIEIYSQVELTKVSILTGVIKIGLKTFLECVRLKTFNKFGFQQIQVDTHYLQQCLYKYVSDEKLLQLLLDEILNSAKHRCLNPVIMDPSVVELISEKG